MCASEHRLRAPAGAEEWRTYHAIRRKVLFENRGLIGVYDEHHPDEFASDHYPMLLLHEGEPIAVIRIDIDGQIAVFRRVAVRDDVQRCGHGKVMLSLAEDFARSRGCGFAKSFVDPQAVGFYERCGFNHEKSTSTDGADAKHVPMFKKWG
jgi:GNAT superfamily N-acetyltransferase